ncbi:MAG: hypothetical protein AAGG44_11730, partial [Planctomycetota bacterium]
VIARALQGYLPIELAFGVLLPSLVSLVDGDWNEGVLKQLDDLGQGKGRLTVEHTVVSRTA